MSHSNIVLDQATQQFYVDVLNLLKESNTPFLVGGAYALAQYAGVVRHTKDLDLFVKKDDAEEILEQFAKAGYKSEMTFSHWLGKAYKGESFIDLIFSSGNGVAVVDDQWFDYAKEAEVFGVTVKLCPPEEMIWSKGFIMERERFDGADVAHILHSCGPTMDWDRLLERFDSHWRVLLTHLILFGFTYPAEKDKIPADVMNKLVNKLAEDTENSSAKQVCHGTLLSREQYLVDTDRWGYGDARLVPCGNMTAKEIDHWTIAIDSK
ncbi:MAG: nucleotidyltransferase [Candidatus Melainabacteria bacterium]|nr:nucleotidyltransferase [Candidatus Melainabacteria bacterium]